jgi:hypothetical protein
MSQHGTARIPRRPFANLRRHLFCHSRPSLGTLLGYGSTGARESNFIDLRLAPLFPFGHSVGARCTYDDVRPFTQWEPFLHYYFDSRLFDPPHTSLVDAFIPSLPHQLWGSIPLYTPNLKPSSLHLHLLYSSIFVIRIRHSKQTGWDEEEN